jgi:hypothetical protein
MADDENERQTGFKVQDRRRFSATGDARDDAPDATSEREPTAPAEPFPGAGEAAHEPAAPQEITFASFVFSLSTQALVHLGEIPDPVDGAPHVHLEGAQQIIDILGMLRDKTRGNLDGAESTLLDNALYDLRMRYVERARRR